MFLPLFSLSIALLCPLPVPAAAIDAPGTISRDSTIEAARAALRQGLSWRASLLLAPAIADSARRSPEAVMLAASAASGWGGWEQVERLLAQEPWLDTEFDGRARALLARAALERRADSAAAFHAAAAVRSAPSERERGERLVILARALDRLDSLDAAAAAYADAAQLLPEIADWLVYRAAIVTTDSAARAARFARIGSPVAIGRIQAGQAEGLDRAGRPAAAAAAYAALTDFPAAYSLRLEASLENESERRQLRSELIEVLRTRSGTSQARAAVTALDAAFAPLDPNVELLVARTLAGSGPASRAASAYQKALGGGLGVTRDRYDYARQLFALGRYAQAAEQFDRVRTPVALAASAAYQRARALVRDGQLSEGRSALRAIGRDYPRETDPAATALFLLADLATDEKRDAPAREAFRAIVTRYPDARLAPAAAFRAATIALIADDVRQAARELDTLALRYPRSDEAAAARYWAGRAWETAGDTAAARIRWRASADTDRTGYYGALSSRRLGETPWLPAPAADAFIPVPDVDSALARAALLERIGMDREARWEWDAAGGGDPTVDRLLATADAFRSRDLASRAIRLAWRAVDRGALSDARTYRLLYPIVHQEALMAEAQARDVDPSFAAALIRQESMFTPGATSPAGARGLMQLMPDVGRTVARGLRFPVWDPVLLYQADVNVQLGMAHLEELMGRYDQPVKVLAAYNAGASRVERWSTKLGVGDPELFTERIPYTETRDYVRIIQRNQDFYRSLYDWP